MTFKNVLQSLGWQSFHKIAKALIAGALLQICLQHALDRSRRIVGHDIAKQLPADVLLGSLDIDATDPVPVWMSAAQFEYWSHTHLTIDVVPGRGGGFSLEAPLGVRFLIRSRLLTEEEMAVLGLEGYSDSD